MNNTQARRSASLEIKSILEKCGTSSGVSLDEERIKNSNKVLFWRAGISSSAALEKSTYIIYTIISSDISTIADNRTKTREVVIELDIYTNKDLNTKSIVELVSKIEDMLIENSWQVEYEEELFDNDNKIYHIPLTISKNF